MADNQDEEKDKIKEEIEAALNAGAGPRIARFALACLGGFIPLAGGFIGGAGGWWSEAEQDRLNKIFSAWLKLQEDEIKEIAQTLAEVMMRLNLNDPEVEERVQSPEYLSLIKKSFREWSAAESEEKRVYIRNLLANAAATRICSDNVIRMFISWIDEYDEAHFAVIREIFNHDGITRGEIWRKVYGDAVREDAAEADLFKLLFRDLSTGGIIRQHRLKDAEGRFLKQPTGSKKSSSRYTTSAFEGEKGYELTELGKWFVHYTMNEIVPRIASPR